VKQYSWEDDAACSPQNRPDNLRDLDWFSTKTEDKYAARAVCQSKCPVRKECLETALTRREIHGIWGACDDYEIRRALSVDSLGDPIERDRPPRCPYCLSKKLDIAMNKTPRGYKTECTECGLTWHMAKIPTKIKSKAARAS